ncbi:hypothetical protein [Lachnoanaerobaculum gingivalis]|uniref:hypothetical protein n=1 Tax=Lachnoanaerobaculum gingivalis TaxID=2490855 RepID=UPI0024A71D86|nr:hypothetical protein [Lachnoanaerobaculum gingivalis]WHE87767.1 hypothetical protein QJR73_01805 [Lachnoanaerobaculum gingivalis]
MNKSLNISVSILWVIIFALDIAIFFVNPSNMIEKITMVTVGLYSVSVMYDSIKSIILGKDFSKNTLIRRMIIGIISIVTQIIILIKYSGLI